MRIAMQDVELAFPPVICKGPLSSRTVNSVGPEYEETEEYLREKTWKDLLSDEFSHDFAETLFFISPEAFSVYAPAYFYWIIDRYEKSDYLPSSLVLCMASTPERLLSRLTHSQLEVVGRILLYLDTVHGVEFGEEACRDLSIAMAEVEKRIGEQHGEAQ